MKEKILGFQIERNSVTDCVKNIFSAIQRVERQRWLACFNPHSYAMSLTDAAFKEALEAANWLVPDGVGVVMASRTLNGSIRKRITGSDIFFKLHSLMNEQSGLSVFFLGSTEDTLAAIRVRMALDYPKIQVVGTFSPPFKSTYSAAELNDIVTAINQSKPDVLWVGMTAPKQEKWIHANLHRLDVRFVGAVGAVFDFYTGKVKRSRPLFQRLGLEWLPRLIQQPRRLWSRMFISAPIFVFHVLRARFMGYGEKNGDSKP